jgi:hypothetical protein
MNRNLSFLLVLAFLTSLASCSSITLTQSAKATSTISSSEVFTPSQTPTPTASPTATETHVLEQGISQACVHVDMDNGVGLSLQGVAVFDHLSQDLITTIFLQDFETATTTNLRADPYRVANFWDVSPNRKYVLYQYDRGTGNDLDYRLIVADARGQTIQDFDNEFSRERASYYNWQNSENIRAVSTYNTPQGSGIVPGIYNPFTKEHWVLKTDFTDCVGVDIDWGLDWFALSTLRLQGTNLVYDPVLTRVLYPKNDEIVSLADAETGDELANIRLPNWGRLPKWSPDGSYISIIGSAKSDGTKPSEEFYIVSRDGGEFKRFTHFSNSFDQSAIADYSWSPDGKKIAFWSYTGAGDPSAEGTQSELMILDVTTGEVTNLCVQGISAVTHLNDVVLFAHLEPIWSPDGNQIMISQWDETSGQNDKSYSVLIVDIPSLTAIKINENKQPVGWMTLEP